MNNYFSFSLMALAGEGSAYFLDVLARCNIWVYISSLLILAVFIIALRKYPKNVSYSKKGVIKISIIFLVLHIISKLFLGTANFELTWDTWRNPRNVYNNFNDSNKCVALSGLYEYSIRDFYMNYLKPIPKKSETEGNFLDEVFSSNNDSFHKNKYTGKFKNKNVIFLQLEGIDNWLLNKETMPNTYKLLDNSINFTEHYSFNNGGGSTFNSEFMVNVGYTTPYTFPMNAYSLNKNDFPYSMANLMQQRDYSVLAYHMNTREYYSRGINYYNWGYDNYLGLEDLGTYTDESHQLDREMILNESFYKELFKKGGKTISYLITYSTHMPFTYTHSVCLGTEALHRAHAIDTLQHRSDVDGIVVGQELLVILPLSRGKGIDKHLRCLALTGSHTHLHYLGRQKISGLTHTVLHVHGSHIRINTLLKIDGD